MRRVGLVIGTLALLAAACGAFAQTTFTWQGSCGTEWWYDTCAIGTCGNNNAYTLRQNNWGSVRCSSDGSPAFPGPGDTAIIPSGFTVRINGSVTVGRIVVQPGATLIWASGNLNVGELVNEGTLEWANGDVWYFGGTVVNRGTWRKTTGYEARLNNATLRNEASGVLELQRDWISRSSGTPTLQNDGLIKKVSSDSAVLSVLVITGTGRVQVQEGALFWGGCTLSNATVQVEQGTLYWNGGVAGNAQIASGTVAVNGSVSFAQNATLTVASSGRLQWGAGNWTMASGAQLVNDGTLEWANGDVWDFGGTVVNRGTWRKTTGYAVRLNNATLRNEASGVLELQRGWIGLNSGTATLQNDGLITKVSSNNAELSGLVITGTGRVQVQEGALFWSSCTLSNATVQVEQGTLYWSGGVAGNAQIAAGSGAVAVNGSVSFAQNATLTVASSGRLQWGAGNWTMASGAQLVNDGTLEWANGDVWDFGGTVVNRGTWRKTTGYAVRLNNATLRNEASGVLELQRGSISRYSGTATLQNDGLITKVSSNNAELSGLVITGTGRVQVQEGALFWSSCTLSNATVQVEQGTLYWSGGVAGNAQIAAGSGAVAVNGNVSLAQDATLTVASGGRLVWSSGNWTMASGAQLVNDGTLEWANGDVWDFGGTVVNRGTWRKTTGYAVRLTNATLRNETSGVLELQRGWIGRSSGTPTLQNEGLIKKVSSDSAELSGLVITGTGRVQVQAGALFWSSCTLSNATVQVEQGTLYWSGGVAGNAQIAAGSGAVAVNGSVSFAQNATLTVASSGRLQWGAGNWTMASGAQLVNDGTLEWANGDVWDFGSTVVNRGTWRKTTVYAVRLNNATLRNEASGVLELQRGSISRYSGTATLQNDGLITKVSSNNAELSGLVITGTGRVQVQEGALFWSSCTLSNATVQVEQGTLYWSGGVAGNAQIAAGSGAVAVNGNVSLAQNATLTVASSGRLQWGAGNWTMASGAQLVNDGTLEWANGDVWDFGGTVVNRGTWRKTTVYAVRLNNATLRNEASGVLELQRGSISRYSGTATLQNEGLIKKVSPDPNNPTSADISGFPVTNRGRIEVVSGILNLTTLTQTDGETRIHRNAFLNLSNPITLQGGKLTGAGQLNGAVVNGTGNATFAAGIDDPDQSDLNPLGILTLNGNLTQNNDTVVEVELAGTDNSDPANPQYDQLVVIGASGRTVQLNGTLRVKGRNGFLPQAGDTFDILVRSGSSWSRTGAFHTVEVDPNTLPCVGFEVQYLADRVRLVAQTLGGPDVNRNGCVDDADLLAVLFAFGQTGGGLAEDVTCDGVVDDADLLGVLFNFGNGCG
jgi:Tfp pilus assembly protein PilP